MEAIALVTHTIGSMTHIFQTLALISQN